MVSYLGLLYLPTSKIWGARLRSLNDMTGETLGQSVLALLKRRDMVRI